VGIIERFGQQFGAVGGCLRIINQQTQRTHPFGMRVFCMQRVAIELQARHQSQPDSRHNREGSQQHLAKNA
jgi:hypothetical protein